MRVALRHDRRFVPEQPLDLVEVHACLNQSRGERMPEIVEMKIVDLGLARNYEPMTKLFIAVIERTLQIHGK